MTTALAIAEDSNNSVGMELADSFIGTIEADFSLQASRNALNSAKHRLRTIIGDFQTLVTDAVRCSEQSEIELATLYVEGCRDELTKCYLAVNRRIAGTVEGRQRVVGIVDRLIARTIEQLDKASQSDASEKAPGKKPRKG